MEETEAQAVEEPLPTTAAAAPHSIILSGGNITSLQRGTVSCPPTPRGPLQVNIPFPLPPRPISSLPQLKFPVSVSPRCLSGLEAKSRRQGLRLAAVRPEGLFFLPQYFLKVFSDKIYICGVKKKSPWRTVYGGQVTVVSDQWLVDDI